MPLPKNPDKHHHNKKFCMPKEYLFKLHVIYGYNVSQIAHVHWKKLGIKVSDRTVRDYLRIYGIFEPMRKPRPKPKPKKPKTYNRKDSAKYLRDRAWAGKDLKEYLDSLSDRYRTYSLREYFINLGRKRLRKNLNNREKEAVAFIIKNYDVSGSLADLVSPNRKIIIDWPTIEEIRGYMELSVYMFCKITKIDRPTYHMVQKSKMLQVGIRKTVLKISRALHIKASEISKEIKDE